ncbi:MSHA biogenesis protein MshO [Shewanella sp. OPT22]|nr:MSHA biogenesis protein MshO [Shewanella sp. OPT22]
MGRYKNSGFTLVELITVILILGIVAVGVSSFVTFGTRIFVDSSSTDQAVNQSRYVLQRMNRELTNALPNSVRITHSGVTQCIEFVPVITSSSYISLPTAGTPSRNTGSIFKDQSSVAINVNQRMYLLGLTTDEADIYGPQDTNNASFVSLTEVTSAGDALALRFNNSVIFAANSARKRIFLTEMPVSYCAAGGELKRYDDYGFQITQPIAFNSGSNSVVARDIVNNLADSADLPFNFILSDDNHDIVQLNLKFQVLDQTIEYHHQVQVVNVP